MVWLLFLCSKSKQPLSPIRMNKAQKIKSSDGKQAQASHAAVGSGNVKHTATPRYFPRDANMKARKIYKDVLSR